VQQHYQWLQEGGRPLRYCHMMDAVRVFDWCMYVGVGGKVSEGCLKGAQSHSRKKSLPQLRPGLLSQSS
jgi:hypothetical protein